MIRTLPGWLQNAIDFIGREFSDDKDVTLTVLYGYSCVNSGEPDDDRRGFALYNTESESIYLADFNEIKNAFGLSVRDTIETTLMNLFHEYRHHQQNIYGLEIDEDDAERFAEEMKNKFLRSM